LLELVDAIDRAMHLDKTSGNLEELTWTEMASGSNTEMG